MDDLFLQSMKAVVKHYPAIVPYLSERARELVELKNAGGLARSVRSAVRALYDSGNINAFTSEMYNYIESQLIAAWFEGMADNGLNRDDITDEWSIQLMSIVAQEQDRVYDFGAEILNASVGISGDVKPITPFLARAELWGNRYNEVVNTARLATAAVGQKMIWTYGDTEHCQTCSALNGIVAFAQEWEVAGVRPQNAPNTWLSCGGWRCKCTLTPTTERHTRDAFGKILQAVSA